METIEGTTGRAPRPKILFGVPTAKDEAQSLMYFIYAQDKRELNWGERVYRALPGLKEKVFGATDKNEFFAKCREYVEQFQRDNEATIEGARVQFQKTWDEVGEKIFDVLDGEFETSLTKDVNANVSVNPICPRFLETQSFNVNFAFSLERAREPAIHEITHFYHFKKWAEVFPDADKKTFNTPHSEWRLSEILAPVMMTYNPAIQEIVGGKKFNTYKEWWEIKIGEKTLIEYFGDIYREHLDKKTSSADFLKKSWEEYQKHKDIIEADRKK